MNYIDTPEEAIECLSYHGRNLKPNTELAQAHEVAIAALEKQMPMKPGTYFWPDGSVEPLCPNCNRYLDIGDYCIKCGQKIDWGDEE